MGHYLSEMESNEEAERRHERELSIFRLHDAGYWHAGVKGPRFGLMGGAEPLHHLPCGQAIFDPAVHDPICPANGKGRQEPRLEEKKR